MHRVCQWPDAKPWMQAVAEIPAARAFLLLLLFVASAVATSSPDSQYHSLPFKSRFHVLANTIMALSAESADAGDEDTANNHDSNVTWQSTTFTASRSVSSSVGISLTKFSGGSRSENASRTLTDWNVSTTSAPSPTISSTISLLSSTISHLSSTISPTNSSSISWSVSNGSATATLSMTVSSNTTFSSNVTTPMNVSATASLNVTESNFTFSASASLSGASSTTSPSHTLPRFTSDAYLTADVLEVVPLVTLPTFFAGFDEWPGNERFAQDVFGVLRTRGFSFLSDRFARSGVFLMLCEEANGTVNMSDTAFDACFEYSCGAAQGGTPPSCSLGGVKECRCPGGPRYPPLDPLSFVDYISPITHQSRPMAVASSSRRAMATRITAQFVIRLDAVLIFFPTHLDEIISVYNALHIAAQHAFEDDTFVARYKIDVGGIIIRRLWSRPTKPPPATPSKKKPNLWWLLLLLLLLVPGAAWLVLAAREHFEDWRFRRRFRITSKDPEQWDDVGEMADAASDADDVMLDALRPSGRESAQWMEAGGAREAAADVSEFDPIAQVRAQYLTARGPKRRGGGSGNGSDEGSAGGDGLAGGGNYDSDDDALCGAGGHGSGAGRVGSSAATQQRRECYRAMLDVIALSSNAPTRRSDSAFRVMLDGAAANRTDAASHEVAVASTDDDASDEASSSSVSIDSDAV